MLYASAQDMRDRYDGLDTLLFQPGSDTLNEKKLSQALSDAGALADSYLTTRYDLPLAVVPQVLVQHCCAIAFYYLCDQQATDQARDRYREALAWLKPAGLVTSVTCTAARVAHDRLRLSVSLVMPDGARRPMIFEADLKGV
ncbi:DUF1320 family protein [Salmonella enterica]|nr:DUF1320 family protein [Salmonella enterica]